VGKNELLDLASIIGIDFNAKNRFLLSELNMQGRAATSGKNRLLFFSGATLDFDEHQADFLGTKVWMRKLTDHELGYFTEINCRNGDPVPEFVMDCFVPTPIPESHATPILIIMLQLARRWSLNLVGIGTETHKGTNAVHSDLQRVEKGVLVPLYPTIVLTRGAVDEMAGLFAMTRAMKGATGGDSSSSLFLENARASYLHYFKAVLSAGSPEQTIFEVMVGMDSLFEFKGDQNRLSMEDRVAKLMTLLSIDAKRVIKLLDTAYKVRNSYAHGNPPSHERRASIASSFGDIRAFAGIVANVLRVSLLFCFTTILSGASGKKRNMISLLDGGDEGGVLRGIAEKLRPFCLSLCKSSADAVFRSRKTV